MKLFVLMFLLLGLVAQAFASDWQFAAWTSKSVIEVDKSSIVLVGGYKKAWVQTTFGTTKDDTPATVVQEKALWYFDCKEQRIEVVTDITMNNAGDVIDSQKLRFTPTNFQEIVPDSIGEKVTAFVCKTPAGPSSWDLTSTNKSIKK